MIHIQILQEVDILILVSAYLADIFKELNYLNAPMQGRRKTTFFSANKIRLLINNIVFWKASTIKGHLLNFPTFSKITMGKSNSKKLNNYFSSLKKSADWIALPVDFTDNVKELDLNNDERNVFIDTWSSSKT